MRNVDLMIYLAVCWDKIVFSDKFLESSTTANEVIARSLAVIKENRAERVGVQRLLEFGGSFSGKRREGSGSSTPLPFSGTRDFIYSGLVRLFLGLLYCIPLFNPPPLVLSPLPRRPTPRRSQQFSTRMVANTGGSL